MKLTQSELNEILSRHGFSFKKSLGQNFLTNENILNKIIADASLTPEDTVLEIGPGAGTLTRLMANRVKKLVAIEIDWSLIPILEETLKDHPNVKVIHADILKLDLDALYKEELSEGFKLVANLPYYITTPIIMRLLESNLPYESLTVLVQREVAQRMSAAPGNKDYGALTCAVQYYTVPILQTRISPGHFYPSPKVESQVITLKKRPQPPVSVADEEIFFKVIHAAFAMRRKTLANNLIKAFNLSREKAEQLLADCSLEVNIRGEQLDLARFAQLANRLASL